MKEKYLRPALVNAGTFEMNGIIPLASVTAVKALALVAGYALGRTATKVMEARPVIKLPNLTKFRSNDDDLCLA